MSKKVLNYAGRQPMMLALIMATIALGLLFSGWLTPTHSGAQGQPNPQPNGETTNCPNYTTNVVTNCPSITSTPQITTPSFCVNEGDSVPDPSYAPAPDASSGSIVTTVTETCSNTVTASTNTLTYSFGNMYFVGPKPSKTAVGAHTSDCYIPVTCSDTNYCSHDPLMIGQVTWTIVDTNVTTIEWDPAKSAACIATALGYVSQAAKASGCSAKGPSFLGKITASWWQTCCNSTNGPYKESSVTGTINVTVGEVACPIPGCSITLPGLNDYAQLGLMGTFSAKGTITGVKGVAQPCQKAPICVNVGLTATVGITGGVVLNMPGGYASCGATVSGTCSASIVTTGPDSNSKCSISGNLGQLKVLAQVRLQLAGFCKNYLASATLWGGVPIGPYETGCMCFPS